MFNIVILTSLCHVDEIAAPFQIMKLMLHVSGPTKTVWVS